MLPLLSCPSLSPILLQGFYLLLSVALLERWKLRGGWEESESWRRGMKQYFGIFRHIEDR